MSPGVQTLFVFLLILPFFIKGILAMFLVDGVLKYEVKHKLAVYISLALLGAGLGLFEAFVSVSRDGADIIIGDIETILIYGITIIILAINIKAKWWKKIIVAFLAVDIIASVDQIFDVLSEQINVSPNWDSLVFVTIVFILFRFLG